MKPKLTLFLYWQDPDSRRWHVVGRLTRDNKFYSFVYTKGSEASPKFIPFGRMTEMTREYKSEHLFPLFANRLLPKSRPEYRDYLKWLGYENLEPDALELLARTGGARVTDSLAIYPKPVPDESGNYHVVFLCHGIRYMSSESISRIEELSSGMPLYPMHDILNKWDSQAVALRTDDPASLIGYCPRYFSRDFLLLLNKYAENIRVSVVRVNKDAPLQLKLLCKFESPWPYDFEPCQDEEYKSLARSSALVVSAGN